jgi:hypothetical protein
VERGRLLPAQFLNRLHFLQPAVIRIGQTFGDDKGDIMKKHVIQAALAIGIVLAVLNFANAQGVQNDQGKEVQDKFVKSLIWFADTNQLKLALAPPSSSPTEFTILAQAVGTNGYWRWVPPTNEMKFRLEVSDKVGTILQPTNDSIELSQRLPTRVRLADYPPLSRSSSSQRYLPLWSGQAVPIGTFDLAQYYNLSEGGKFTVRITPILYDAQPDPYSGQLTEFPTATYDLHLLKPKNAAPGTK